MSAICSGQSPDEMLDFQSANCAGERRQLRRADSARMFFFSKVPGPDVVFPRVGLCSAQPQRDETNDLLDLS